MTRWFLLAGVFLMSSVYAAAPESSPPAGAMLLKPFKQQLQAALQEGMQRGPVDAIAACRVQAPAIAESLSIDGVRVGRASHRLRNPANAPPAWVQPVIDAYLADAAARAPRSVQVSADVSGYVEPIVLQPLCVTCHGVSIAPDLGARIAVLYPDDQATGFEPGELRGVFWVEYPAGNDD